MKRPITILNLSDLHINAKGENGNDMEAIFEKSMDAYYSYIYNSEKIEHIKWHPNYIVMPGDIVDGRTEQQDESFTKAEGIIEKLLVRFKLLNQALILAPGNHDKRNISDKEMNNEGKLGYQKRRYKGIKDNFEEFCSPHKTQITEVEFMKFHEKDFGLFADFNRKFVEGANYCCYPKFKDSQLKYVSGVKFFTEHKVCFLCLNTEWLYTRSKIERDAGGHLCRPIVKYLCDVLSKPEYADYTIVTLMHRKPDDLSWEAKNQADERTYDPLLLLEQCSDVIISGHDHAIRTNRPDMIKNYIQHFKLGSPSCPTAENERFPYSISAINLDPINLTLELLVGTYNKENQWEFKTDGLFPLRDKYKSRTNHKKDIRCGTNDLIHLKAPSAHEEDVERVIRNYFGTNSVLYIDIRYIGTAIRDMAIPLRPTHLVLYAINTGDTEIDYLQKTYAILNERIEIQKSKLLMQLVISRIIIDTPETLKF